MQLFRARNDLAHLVGRDGAFEPFGQKSRGADRRCHDGATAWRTCDFFDSIDSNRAQTAGLAALAGARSTLLSAALPLRSPVPPPHSAAALRSARGWADGWRAGR